MFLIFLLLYISVVVDLVFQSTYISFFLLICFNSSFVIHFSFLSLPLLYHLVVLCICVYLTVCGLHGSGINRVYYNIGPPYIYI